MKYVHTNIITDDWKRLAQFYIQAFACKMTLPQRNFSGEWLSRATGVSQAQLKGAHLRLPGWGNQGPTLEIFQYTKTEGQPSPLSNRKGLGLIAFEVDDVEAALQKALAFGGQRYGDISVHTIEQLGTLTFVYLRDPDGNIIELQNWGKPVEIPVQELSKKVPTKHTTNDKPKPLDKKEIPTEFPDTIELPNPEIKQSTDSSKEDKNNLPDATLDKRAFLDALQKDLDNTRDSINLSKAEIKASKESLKYKQQHTEQHLQYTPDALEDGRHLKKDKKELLQELKNEVAKEDLDSRVLPDTPVSEKNATPPIPVEQPLLPAALKKKGQLRVELKIDGATQTLELATLELGLPPNELATRLLLYTAEAHPKNKQLSFLEYLGQCYRADLVPLVKSLQWTDKRAEQEKAWVFVPRFEGSLQHLLEQCKKQPLTLKNLDLESLGSSPKDFIITYEAVQRLVANAQAQGATYVRLAYTADLAVL